MKNVEISYNPYKMKTTMLVDGIDVCTDRNYDKFKEFIENKIPLQTWIEPIPYMTWGGFVNEISDPESNDEVKVTFTGRVIDFEDLKRSIKAQNQTRERESQVTYHYEHKTVLDDRVLSKNIDDVVKELNSDRFQRLVDQRTAKELKNKYSDLNTNYKMAKESEFYVVLTGMYSSGKSTLLNALIRHDVLPTSQFTCTSKNCRIRHDRSLGSKLSLTCYDDNDHVVINKRVFNNDADCTKAFQEICPTKKSDSGDSKEKISIMELGVDLSHLYPDSISEDKFTIVLIDTPGIDSSKESKNGQNKHKDIALDAISMENKPMVILCVDAQKYEDKSIGEFMREIIEQAKEEGGGFNDRYLFLMNKSDLKHYMTDEKPDDVKTGFAEYLTNCEKWGISEDKEDLQQLAKDASHFVPRVFMTAAAPGLAITSSLVEIPEENIDNDHYHLREAYDDFKKKLKNPRFLENYHLSKYCDIPNYRKAEIETEFDSAMNEGNYVRATELQCGLVSVELAIKDYIERYAYPIKVRSLLETFEDILNDVNGFAKGEEAELKKKYNKMGEADGERREAIETKESVEEKIAILESARKEFDIQLKKLDDIQFDEKTLKKAISDFRESIEADAIIRFFREKPRVHTGLRSRSDVENEINGHINHIKAVFDSALRKTNDQLERIKKTHDQQLVAIFNILKDILTKVEDSGVIAQGEFNFKSCVFWKMHLENINANRFIAEIKKVDGKAGNREIRNPKKERWENGGFFKRIGAKFLREYITVPYREDGYYDATSLVHHLDDYLYNLANENCAMENQFKEIINNSKNQVRNVTSRLIEELQAFLNDIKNQTDRIQELSKSMESLQAEITESEKTREWLNMLENKIVGV